MSLALFACFSSFECVATWGVCHAFALPAPVFFFSAANLSCQNQQHIFLSNVMLFSSHLTVVFFAYSPRRLFVCFLHFECGFFKCCDIWPRHNIKATWLKEIAQGGIISHLFVVLLCRLLCIFLGNFHEFNKESKSTHDKDIIGWT